MALATKTSLSVYPQRVTVVNAAAIVGEWVNAILAGGPATLDNAALTNPTGQITAATRRIIGREMFMGALIAMRLAYDPTLTGITAAVCAVFGRTGTNGWQRMQAVGGLYTFTFTPVVATDERDPAPLTGAQTAYTRVDKSAHVFDPMGCDEFLVGTEVAFNGATGVLTNSAVQLKGF